MRALHTSKVKFGPGHITRFTLLEIKDWFSIYIHFFHDPIQDRFHTHAWDAVSFILRGEYTELQKRELPFGDTREEAVLYQPGVRFIPRNCNHKLVGAAPGTITMVIAGPWHDTWTEETSTWKRVLGWGRRQLSIVYK